MIEDISKKIILDDLYEIREYFTANGNVRALYHDDAVQSIEYVDLSKKNLLCDKYLYFFDLPIYLYISGKNYLLLGGGAFSYPKYFISKYIEKKITVVENNQKCIKYAKEYFALDKYIRKYDSMRNKLNIFLDDAINYISQCDEKYDYILIDLFNGNRPINDIYTDDNIGNIKRLLNEKGVVVINYIITNHNRNVYKKYLRNITSDFKYFKIISNNLYFNKNFNIGNIVLILSNDIIKIPKVYDYINLDYLVN